MSFSYQSDRQESAQYMSSKLMLEPLSLIAFRTLQYSLLANLKI